MFQYEDSEILSVYPSVCLYLESRNQPTLVNISPTVVIDTSMERSSRVGTTAWEPPKIYFL